MRPDQEFEAWICSIRKKDSPTARRTRASGALRWEPGDIHDPRFHIECKHSIKDYIIVQYEWWEKALEEADRRDKIPILAVGYSMDWVLGQTVGFIRKSEDQDILPLDNWPCKSRTMRKFTPTFFTWMEQTFEIFDKLPAIVFDETSEDATILEFISGFEGGVSKLYIEREFRSLGSRKVTKAIQSLVERGGIAECRGVYTANE